MWYISRGLNVIPVNPREEQIEGINCIQSIDQLEEPTTTSLSFITPPSVTDSVLEQAIALGVRAVWFQPGAESENSVQVAEEAGIIAIGRGSCILRDGQIPSL